MSNATDAHDRIGPGRLVLVVGPSGAGKDTLIDLARASCRGPDIVFVRRAVTRSGSDAEDNEQFSVAAFEEAMTQGAFTLHWQAHGHRYGVPRSIEADIEAGRTVVANVSRTMIAQARQMYRNVVVVMITAPPDVLAARLALRARDSDGDVRDRLRRTVDDAAIVADITILNVDQAASHAQELVRVIDGPPSWTAAATQR